MTCHKCNGTGNMSLGILPFVACNACGGKKKEGSNPWPPSDGFIKILKEEIALEHELRTLYLEDFGMPTDLLCAPLEKTKGIYEEIRKFAKENKVAIWTASQQQKEKEPAFHTDEVIIEEGPLGTPITMESFEEFKDRFGELVPSKGKVFFASTPQSQWFLPEDLLKGTEPAGLNTRYGGDFKIEIDKWRKLTGIL